MTFTSAILLMLWTTAQPMHFKAISLIHFLLPAFPDLLFRTVLFREQLTSGELMRLKLMELQNMRAPYGAL